MTRERKENSWTQTAPNSFPGTYIHGLQKCDRTHPPSAFSLLEVIEGLFGGFNMRARVFLRNKLFIKDRQHEQKILSIQFLLNRDWMFLPRILTNCFIEWVVIQVTPVTDPSYRLWSGGRASPPSINTLQGHIDQPSQPEVPPTWGPQRFHLASCFLCQPSLL